MKHIAKSRSGKLKPRMVAVRVCRECGCTEDRACPGGCSWANEDRDLCTGCSGGGCDAWDLQNAIGGMRPLKCGELRGLEPFGNFKLCAAHQEKLDRTGMISLSDNGIKAVKDLEGLKWV